MRRRDFLALSGLLAYPAWGAERVRPKSLGIAAASDLKFAMDELIARFQETRPGQIVRVSYGSSGTLLAQIRAGAPFDVFFSADADYPRTLEKDGLGDGPTFLYATGHLAIWVPKASPLEVETKGLKALTGPAAKKVAIANPRHAPYGRAAEAALRSAGLYDALEPKLVFAENVAQAAHFVESGAADAGLVARALGKARGMGEKVRFVDVPEALHPKLTQGGLVLKASKNLAAAQAFRAFALSEAGKAIFVAYGFSAP